MMGIHRDARSAKTCGEAKPSIGRYVAQVVAVAAAVLITGRLGLLLAVAPSLATAVFPPAGIALGAVLLLGPRVAVGVFAGSLILNYQSFATGPEFSGPAQPLLIAAAISIGSTLQALLGSLLIHRFVGMPTRLADELSAAKFFTLGGPVSCLVAATFGVAALATAGLLEPGTGAINWFTWWIGDSIGVVVFAPFIMILLAEPRDAWRGRWLSVGVPLGLTFCLIIAIFLFVRNEEQENVRLRFARRANTLASALTSRLDGYSEVLRMVVSFYDSSVQVERVEFGTFVRSSLERYRGLQALEWIPAVPHAQRAEFEEAARADAGEERLGAGLREALSGFEFTEKSMRPGLSRGQLVAAAAREEYFPVYFVEPYAGNLQVLGFDVGSDPTRRAALIRARDRAHPVTSERIALVQEGTPAAGVLVFFPVYTGSVIPPADQRRQRLQGFVVGVFHVGDMIAGALEGVSEEGVALRIIDADAAAPRRLIHSKCPSGETDPHTATGADPTADADALQDGIHHLSTYAIADRQWQLHFTPTRQYMAAQQDWHLLAILTGGMLFTGNLAGFLLVMTGRTRAIEDLVAQRTDELTRTNLELRRSNLDLQQFVHVASHDLQEPLRAVSSFCELIETQYSDRLDDKGRQYVHYVVDGAARMKILLTDLLEYSRVNTAGQPFRSVDCSQVLATVMANLEAPIEESGASVTKGELPTIPADATQLEQLFRNLIGNAIIYCENGAPEVHIDARRRAADWLFAVRDNGIGIEPQYADQIFDIFQRLHTRDRFPGTGMGLAICKRIVERHQGQIWVESTPGEGSAFFFTIPSTAERNR